VAGSYALVVDTRLEDLAGNNLTGPFEVDVFERASTTTKTEPRTLPFAIR
jgi:hypothetical protein